VKLGILASGRGSNLRNLADRGFEVVAVATNRPLCGAAEFARERGIPLGEFSQKHYASVLERDLAMRDWLQLQGAELIVNAGYDRILAAEFIHAFPGRVINVHPSLLPAFGGGMDAVAKALAGGVKITGCTVHLVTEEVDAGPILLQAAVPVLPDDTVQSLHARIQVAEHRLLPEAILLVSDATRTAVGQ
jgi:phosphoribosylglycinamide formyltransferase-1